MLLLPPISPHWTTPHSSLPIALSSTTPTPLLAAMPHCPLVVPVARCSPGRASTPPEPLPPPAAWPAAMAHLSLLHKCPTSPHYLTHHCSPGHGCLAAALVMDYSTRCQAFPTNRGQPASHCRPVYCISEASVGQCRPVYSMSEASVGLTRWTRTRSIPSLCHADEWNRLHWQIMAARPTPSYGAHSFYLNTPEYPFYLK